MPDDVKTCKDCGQAFPRTADFFYRAKRMADGFVTECKKCRNLKHREWVSNNRERSREHSRRAYANNIEKRHAYNVQRRSHRTETRQAWRVNNRQRDRDNMQRWRTAHPDYDQEWRRSHPEQSKDTRKHAGIRRRARRLNLPCRFSPMDWQHALTFFDHRCAVCGRAPSFWQYLAQEHWIPVADPRPDNPGTVPGNILPVCHTRKGFSGMGSCNLSKQDKDPIVWLNEHYSPRRAKAILQRIDAYVKTVELRIVEVG